MADKVFIIVGMCGEHSEHTEWCVSAYREKDVANLHADNANAWCNANELATGPDRYRVDHYRFPEQTGKNPYDPDMQTDRTGTNYVVVEVPLFLHPDEFIEAQEAKQTNG